MGGNVLHIIIEVFFEKESIKQTIFYWSYNKWNHILSNMSTTFCCSSVGIKSRDLSMLGNYSTTKLLYFVFIIKNNSFSYNKLKIFQKNNHQFINLKTGTPMFKWTVQCQMAKQSKWVTVLNFVVKVFLGKIDL